MSDLETKKQGLKFVPVAQTKSQGPGAWRLLFGAVFPAIVIVIELSTRMCATALFDPMPTLWHTLAVCFVPACNAFLWCQLNDGRLLRPPRQASRGWLAFANGAAIGIAGFYALIFLPLVPVALIGVVAYGIGLLPLAPLVAFCSAIGLAARTTWPSRSQVWRGFATGVALLVILDIPAASTRLGIQWAASSIPVQRERGLALLRTLGDDDLLLRLCYETTGRTSGLLSALVMLAGPQFLDGPDRQIAQSTTDVREIYYRVHGTPFNAKPPPFQAGRWERFNDMAFDADHGGAAVGGRIRGLDIVSSRLDGSVSGDDAVAYLEWTFEFRNTSAVDRETRLQLALPPGGVVSRATLWVNGEEREAAYAGRGEVRAAYQKIAVQQRRDPLLVTTKGAGRVLAQAFPVPRNGGTIKFKLGITAPLELLEPGKARLTLPAIFDRNFSFGPDAVHNVWIESKQPLATTTKGLTTTIVAPALYRLAGAISDPELASSRPLITAGRDPGAAARVARLGDGAAIAQDILPGVALAPATLMLVIDGSARMRGMGRQLIAALDALPPSTRVGVIIAAEPKVEIAPAPWTDRHKQAVQDLLRATAFSGGQDNGPAIAEALRVLETEANAQLLWVHGPQPVNFQGSAAQLEQATARLSRLPRVSLYSVEPSPNEMLPDAPWAWDARLIPGTGEPATDIGADLARTLTLAPLQAVRRQQEPASGGGTKGSDHIARLWARDRILDLMRTNPAAHRAAAVELAATYRLVTPVSGAVVLETKQQYADAGLTPVGQGTVPTVPEPHEWALIIVALGGLTWLTWQRRRQMGMA